MSIRIVPEIDYPESDGKPMAETPLHMRVMWDVISMLMAWFAPKRRVYVWGNMFLYYVPGDPRKNVSPDVMVVKGVDKERERTVFKVWEEGHGPCAAIEISSRKTRREDVTTKYQLYQDVLKVQEYFLFDPKAEYLKPPLKGYRLHKGLYRPIAEVDGRLPSKELGLHLERHGEELRLWDPTVKTWLPTPREEREQAAQMEKELLELKAETKRLRRELEARNGKNS